MECVSFGNRCCLCKTNKLSQRYAPIRWFRISISIRHKFVINRGKKRKRGNDFFTQTSQVGNCRNFHLIVRNLSNFCRIVRQLVYCWGCAWHQLNNSVIRWLSDRFVSFRCCWAVKRRGDNKHHLSCSLLPSFFLSLLSLCSWFLFRLLCLFFSTALETLLVWALWAATLQIQGKDTNTFPPISLPW